MSAQRSMTRAEKTERICLPRRLVPRRPVSYADKICFAINESRVPRFAVGDILKFVTESGWQLYVTILGIYPCGSVDAMAYDGMPHHFVTTIEDLAKLRITAVEGMGPEDVKTYRELLDLDLSADLGVSQVSNALDC